MTHKPIKLLRQIYYFLLDCKIKLLFVAHSKKQYAKHSIYDCQSQTEIEKVPIELKKYESSSWNKTTAYTLLLFQNY